MKYSSRILSLGTVYSLVPTENGIVPGIIIEAIAAAAAYSGVPADTLT